MRFKKRPRTLSIKHFVINFEKVLREVVLGRVVLVTRRQREVGVLVPIAPKERFARRRKPTKRRHLFKGPRW